MFWKVGIVESIKETIKESPLALDFETSPAVI
jgi:hypothetical protein